MQVLRQQVSHSVDTLVDPRLCDLLLSELARIELVLTDELLLEGLSSGRIAASSHSRVLFSVILLVGVKTQLELVVLLVTKDCSIEPLDRFVLDIQVAAESVPSTKIVDAEWIVVIVYLELVVLLLIHLIPEPIDD